MARIVHLQVLRQDCDGVKAGDIVRCGAAGALWSVFERHEGDPTRFTLHPVDPHHVSLGERIVELPYRY